MGVTIFRRFRAKGDDDFLSYEDPHTKKRGVSEERAREGVGPLHPLPI